MEEYVQFAATAGDLQSGAGDAQLAEGLRKLAGALATLNAGGPELAIDLRIDAEHVLLNPASTETTAMVRDDLLAAAQALTGTETDRALREAAESIRPDRPFAEQWDEVFQFLRRAGDAVQRRAAQPRDIGG